MFQDICFPKGNEEEFAKKALALGTKSLIFVYEFRDMPDFEIKKKKLSQIKSINAEIGILINEKSINRLQNTDEYIFCCSPSRELLESKKTYIMYGFEEGFKPDFLHHRNSGLNQVLCEIMKEKGKALGFSFSSLLNANNFGVILGRMQQNARLARKYNLKTVYASFANSPLELRAEHEIKSFERILQKSI